MKAGSESVRVGLAQINPTVGDLEGNVKAIKRSIADARKLGIQILAFPEFVLCGYPPEDLLLKPRFLSDCEKALRSLAKSARGIAVIVGAPESPAAEKHVDLREVPPTGAGGLTTPPAFSIAAE